MEEFDLAVVGSGFAGSLLAMIGRRLGLKTVLFERGAHPRFAIGESATPLAGIALERLCGLYDLPQLLPLTSWGLWRKRLPELGVGLKRGFTFFHHEFGRPFAARVDRSDHLFVAASPHNAISDAHWLRADVDAFFVKQAAALGADYRDRTDLKTYRWEGESGVVSGERGGEPFSVRTRFLIDCSGEGEFLVQALGVKKIQNPFLPSTCTLYNHFRGVKTWEAAGCALAPGEPPYPFEAAAVHHIFDGGWIWLLRFDDGLVSAGVVAEEPVARELGLSDGPAGWARLMERLPSVRAMFAQAKPTMQWRYADPLPRLCETLVGKGWALAPHAAAFVDPLFSSGIALTLAGVERLGGALERLAKGEEIDAALKEYDAAEKAEVMAMSKLIGACYKTFDHFPLCLAVSQLYFVAVSYAETAWRLNRPDRAGKFLLCDNPEFAEVFQKALDNPILTADRASLTPQAVEKFAAEIAAAMKPWNIAGLCDPAKRNWYGFNLDDLLPYGPAFGASEADMAALAAGQKARIEERA